MFTFFTKRFTREAGFLLGVCLLFFLLRFPSLYEPYWYGDEGIYFTIGKALGAGRTLYLDIWDNKPPLLYWFYFLFNDLFSIRFASLLSGLSAVIAFFFLSREFFRKKYVQYLSTLLFSLFFALPSIEGNIANAENFMLFPIITGALLFWLAVKKITTEKKSSLAGIHTEQRLLLVAGLCLGIALMFKTVAIFDFTAFLLFLLVITFKKQVPVRKHLLSLKHVFLSFIAGFSLPLFCVSLLFLFQGALPAFLETIFLGNISYVGENNALLIPQGLLLTKLIALLLILTLLIRMKHILSLKIFFVLVWVSFSVFNAFFSHRPYIHYQLVMLPSLALAIGMIFDFLFWRQRLFMSALVLTVIVLLYNSFPHWNAKKTGAYYQNFLSFVSGEKSFQDYQTFFDRSTPRDYAVADYLSLHRVEGESLFLWGNSAQIYYLSETLPAGRFTVAYHITTPETIEETRAVFRNSPPRFLVLLPGTQQFPFIIPEYTYKLNIGDALIYEKIN